MILVNFEARFKAFSPSFNHFFLGFVSTGQKGVSTVAIFDNSSNVYILFLSISMYGHEKKEMEKSSSFKIYEFRYFLTCLIEALSRG